MSRKLLECDILELLSDGYNSDIGSIDNEDDFFPGDELQDLLCEFENEDIDYDLPNISDNDNNTILNENNYSVTDKKSIKWLNEPFQSLNLQLDDLENEVYPTSMPSPIDYFYQYFHEDFFDTIAFNTTLYTVQKGIQFQPTNGMEIKSLIAIHIIMGSLKFPRVRMYWEEAFRINIVANTMTRDRFFQLRSNLHIIDNNSISINNKDKFIKVRPLYDLIKKKCNSLVMERNLSVDEQMVPFKGTLSVKQYMKGKPCPWGIKIYVLAGQSGTVYDFLLYQGASTEINSDLQKQFGIGGATVLQLTKGVKKNSHFLYFDNFFSSFQLFERLYKKGIYAAGTIRTNRFANPPLLADKIMSKMGRGTSYEIKSKKINNFSLGILKWYYNKPVNIASNFITSGEVEIIKRWDKKNKLYVEIERPEIITLYNKSMGGVDKID